MLRRDFFGNRSIERTIRCHGLKKVVKPFLHRLGTMLLRTAASISRSFSGRGPASPDPAKPLAVEWHLAKTAERGHRLFVFLPGRRDRASDFVRHEFVGLAQSRVRGLDCLTVDATLGYYLDGSVAERLQREIIEPARANGYREIWLMGVSMGGLGAFF